jgi:hypothetical protein
VLLRAYHGDDDHPDEAAAAVIAAWIRLEDRDPYSEPANRLPVTDLPDVPTRAGVANVCSIVSAFLGQ